MLKCPPSCNYFRKIKPLVTLYISIFYLINLIYLIIQHNMHLGIFSRNIYLEREIFQCNFYYHNVLSNKDKSPIIL